MSLENRNDTLPYNEGSTTSAGLSPWSPPDDERSGGMSRDLGHLISELRPFLGDKVLYRLLLGCREALAQKLLDSFQELLDFRGLDRSFRRSLIVATQRLSEKSSLYPACYHLREVKYAGDPVAAGSFADIYKGSFRDQSVCVKVIRLYQTSRVEYFLKKCAKEALLWGQLTHSNICPIYGLYRRKARICLVSPWMDNGDLNHYLEQYPQADRLLLMCDAARGLSYLHDSGIIHGDLKGANILISASGRAHVADFGLSSVSDPNILAWTSHSSAESKGGSVRWQAPELFDFDGDETVPNSKASDIYAWSCSCYEAFTGTVPFASLQRDATVMLQVKSGITPSRPPNSSISWSAWGLTESVWSVMMACWKADPFSRPTVRHIIESLTREMREDLRPPDDYSVLSSARFRREMNARVDMVSAEELQQLRETGSTHLEEHFGDDTPSKFQGLTPAYLEFPKDNPNGMPTLDISSDLDEDGSETTRKNVAVTRSANNVPGISANHYTVDSRAEDYKTPTGGAEFLPIHARAAHSVHAPYHQQNLNTTVQMTTEHTIPVPYVLARPDNAGSKEKKSKPSGAKEYKKLIDRSDPSPHSNVYRQRSTDLWGSKLGEVKTAISKGPPSSLLSSQGGPPSHTYNDPSFYNEDEISVPSIPAPFDISLTNPGYNHTSHSPSSSSRSGSSRSRPLPGNPLPSIPLNVFPPIVRPRSTPLRTMSSSPVTARYTGVSETSFASGSAQIPSVNPPAPLRRPMRQLPQPPAATSTAPPSPRAHATVRPRPEDVYERLEEFFPELDLDKPVLKAVSDETPLAGAESAIPIPSAPAVPNKVGTRGKKSIRIIVEEHKKYIDRKSQEDGTLYPQALRKRSIKLWDSKLEEAVTDVSKYPSSLPSDRVVSGSNTTGSTFKWVRGELIGRGTYAHVFLALNANTGEMIVAKQVELPRTATDRIDLRKAAIVQVLKTESEILKDLDHPNIIQYLGFEDTSDIFSIFLEYVPGGSVGSHLLKYGRLEENVTKSFTRQILAGLEYLHSRGILHRNLKADNILFEMSGICKISSFGISKETDDNGRAFEAMVGTVFWMAPEIISTKNSGYNSKIDIWSLCCVVLEMWTGSRPWDGEETVAVMFKLYQSKQSPPVPKDLVLSALADDFRRKCFAIDPDERPTAAELRKHAYLTLPPDWVFTGLWGSSIHLISNYL